MPLIVSQFKSKAFVPSLSEGSVLFRQIREQLMALDNISRAADVMEYELHGFLEIYYSRILPLTARLERLRYRKAYGRFPAELSQNVGASSSQRGNHMLASFKKSLFRRLAKRCHPDSNNNAAVAMAEINQAKTLSALWQLEIRCVCDTLPSSLEINQYLSHQLAEIRQLSRRARNASQLLCFSDMWQLKDRVEAASLRGEDLIEQIQRRVEMQIAALQQYFVKPRGIAAAA